MTGVQMCALPIRSEEHTSELQPHDNLVCRLLLEKNLKPVPLVCVVAVAERRTVRAMPGGGARPGGWPRTPRSAHARASVQTATASSFFLTGPPPTMTYRLPPPALLRS